MYAEGALQKTPKSSYIIIGNLQLGVLDMPIEINDLDKYDINQRNIYGGSGKHQGGGGGRGKSWGSGSTPSSSSTDYLNLQGDNYSIIGFMDNFFLT